MSINFMTLTNILSTFFFVYNLSYVPNYVSSFDAYGTCSKISVITSYHYVFMKYTSNNCC